MEGSKLEEVRILKMVDGKLVYKKILSKKMLIERHWKQFTVNTVTKKKIKLKKPKVSHYVRVPQVDHICKICKEPFKGLKARVYCHNPCTQDEKVSKPPKVPCRMCKEMFQPKRRKVNFCHNPCKYKEWIKLNRRRKVND